MTQYIILGKIISNTGLFLGNFPQKLGRRAFFVRKCNTPGSCREKLDDTTLRSASLAWQDLASCVESNGWGIHFWRWEWCSRIAVLQRSRITRSLREMIENTHRFPSMPNESMSSIGYIIDCGESEKGIFTVNDACV